MTNSSYFPLAILAIAGIVLFLTMNFLAGEDRKLPPASTPEGKQKRIIMSFALVVFISAGVFYINNSGRLSEEGDLRRMIISMAAGAAVVLAPFVMKGNDK